ncbi:GNAT family N-acetyltransferase [Usitatibacter palustris]|nr:GNAT family N-acetyltransferase [Usitatibacter palustris]
MRIRIAEPHDVAAIAAIYGHYVLHGLGTFELEPPGEAEMRRRFDIIKDGGFPYFVAEVDGRVAGYSYAGTYRPRPGYRFSLEDSIYVAPEHAGAGIGRALLERLLPACEAIGCRQLIAIIGDSGNTPSIALHEAMGFVHVGVLKSIGFKFGRWVDTVVMQRPLGAGDATLP